MTQAAGAGKLMIAMDKPRSARQAAPPPGTPLPTGRRYLLKGQAIEAPALAPGLHVVATPIGNLRDITLRALETLAAADVIACEDTRVTRKLIDHYGIATALTPYHEHNAAQARPKILARLASGGVVRVSLHLWVSEWPSANEKLVAPL